MALSLHNVYANTWFAQQMQTKNKRYIQDVNDVVKEQRQGNVGNKHGSISYTTLQEINTDRFLFAAGAREGTIVDRSATDEEMNAFAESLWQHAACCMENKDISTALANFNEDAFKDAVSALVNTLRPQNPNQRIQKNAEVLIHGLRYAIAYLAGERNHFQETKKNAEQFGNIRLIRAMDTYFKDMYDGVHSNKNSKLYMMSGSHDAFKNANRGHFNFVLPLSKKKIHVTLMARENVTAADTARDYGDIKDYKRESPLYAMRLQTWDEYKKEQDAKEPLFRETKLPTQFDYAIMAPLSFSKYNTQDYPNQWSRFKQAYVKNIWGEEDVQFEHVSDNWGSINIKLTFEDDYSWTQSRLGDWRSPKENRLSYIYTPLDFFFAEGKPNEWSLNQSYMLHSNTKRSDQKNKN